MPGMPQDDSRYLRGSQNAHRHAPLYPSRICRSVAKHHRLFAGHHHSGCDRLYWQWPVGYSAPRVKVTQDCIITLMQKNPLWYKESVTLPETNSSPLKMHSWKMKILFGMASTSRVNGTLTRNWNVESIHCCILRYHLIFTLSIGDIDEMFAKIILESGNKTRFHLISFSEGFRLSWLGFHINYGSL